MDNQYETGKYWEGNSTFHEEDSDYKFQNFVTLLERNPKVIIDGITDLGCGAGRIIWNFAKKYPRVNCKGVDLDPKIISYAAEKYKADNLSFEVSHSVFADNTPHKLVLLADVIEHVEDYLGFLKNIHQVYTYQLFNIPLDLSIRGLIRNGPVISRNTFGHLHYFYDKLALQMLEENGFTVIDLLYADNIAFDYSKAKGILKCMLFIKLFFARICNIVLGKSRVSRLLGCYSLTVLCSAGQIDHPL